MANISVTIPNQKQLEDLANKFPSVAQRYVDEAIVRSIGEIARQAQPITPVRTRRLWADLSVPHFAPFQGSMGSNLPYAAEVHDKYSPGTPYKNPSLNKNAVAGFLTIAVQGAQNVITQAFQDAADNIVKALQF